MSERAASSCYGKKRHPSMRKAEEAARSTQRSSGTPMRAYPCHICKGFHVGSVDVKPEGYMDSSREQRIQRYTNYNHDRSAKTRFGRKPI